jgi:hypothetical protein
VPFIQSQIRIGRSSSDPNVIGEVYFNTFVIRCIHFDTFVLDDIHSDTLGTIGNQSDNFCDRCHSLWQILWSVAFTLTNFVMGGIHSDKFCDRWHSLWQICDRWYSLSRSWSAKKEGGWGREDHVAVMLVGSLIGAEGADRETGLFITLPGWP